MKLSPGGATVLKIEMFLPPASRAHFLYVRIPRAYARGY